MRKSMIKIVAIASLLLVMHGCGDAQPTPYQRMGYSGGYSDTQLDENVFRVSFVGNGYTHRETAIEFALLRSAELTLEKGFLYFAIIESDAYVSTSIRTYSSSNSNGTYSGAYSVSKPSPSNVIVCFKEKPEKVFAYNAKIVYKSIYEKYGIGIEKPKPKPIPIL